jgi:hypothetical protein
MVCTYTKPTETICIKSPYKCRFCIIVGYRIISDAFLEFESRLDTTFTKVLYT